MDPVLLHNLDRHALEIDGQTSLQLIRAHAQYLHALLEVDVGVVVLIQDRETVVSSHAR